MNPFRRHDHEWYRADEQTWRCYRCRAVTHDVPWDERELAARELEADAMGVRAGLIAPAAISAVWHFYPDAQEFVPVDATALCGHVADVETTEQIEPGDFRCVECVYLLDVQDAER